MPQLKVMEAGSYLAMLPAFSACRCGADGRPEGRNRVNCIGKVAVRLLALNTVNYDYQTIFYVTDSGGSDSGSIGRGLKQGDEKFHPPVFR